MKPYFFLLFLLIFSACQTVEVVPTSNPQKQTPVSVSKPPVVDAGRKIPKKTSRKKMAMAKPKPRVEATPILSEPLPPNTISNCPAGLNGALVGRIDLGRHCFTNEPIQAGRCLGRNDDEVRKKAISYCQELKSHWTRTGDWKFGPELDLKINLLKRSSCRCGTWRGKPLCKSFFQFECETIRL